MTKFFTAFCGEQVIPSNQASINFGDKPAPESTLAKASEAVYPEAAKELRTHVYVDDIGGSREREAKCKQVTSEIHAIFQIKAWHSNNNNVDQSDE